VEREVERRGDDGRRAVEPVEAGDVDGESGDEELVLVGIGDK
jgi:hypothetical protein